MAECAAHILATAEQKTDVVLHTDTYAPSGGGQKSRVALEVAHQGTCGAVIEAVELAINTEYGQASGVELPLDNPASPSLP